MTTLFDLVAKISCDTSEYVKAISDIQGQTKGLSSISVAVGNLISKGFETAVNSVKSFGSFIMQAGTSFESTMSKVQAISGASSEELGELTLKAQEMGQKTKFSATEAGEAFTYMAMAGWKSQEMLNGISGVMNLAAASGENLGTVSDIVTDAMTAFGLSAEKSAHFADVLAVASSNSNTNVGMLGESFKYVAPVAGALGITAEDTAVALGLLANAGIKASQGGTSLRTGLQNLISPSKQMQEAMNKYNIELKSNEDGSINLMATMENLRQNFGQLSESEQAAAASAIFGKEASAGWLAIINASESDFNKLTEAINNADGAAENMATVMQDNLSGSLTILQSNIESLALAFFEGIDGTAKTAVDGLTEAVSKMTEKVKAWMQSDETQEKLGQIAEKVQLLIDKLIQNLDPILDGVIELFGKLVDTIVFAIEHFDQIASAVQLVIEGFVAFKVAMAALQIMNFISSLGALAAAFNPIGLAVTALIATLALLVTKWDDVKRGAQLVVQDIKNAWEGLKQFFSDVANGIVQAFSEVSPTLGAIFEQAFTTIKAVWDTVGAYFGAVWDTIKGVFAVVKDVLSGDFSAAWEAIKGIVGTWVNYFKQIWENIKKVFSAVANTFKTFFSDAWKAVQTVWNVATKFFGDIFEGIVKTFSSIPGKIGEFFSSAWEKAKQAWANVTGFFSEVGNNILKIFTQLPEKFTHIGKWIVEGLWNGINSMVQWISGKIKGFTDSVITGFKNFFGIASPSKVMENEVGKFLGMGIGKGIEDEAGYIQKAFDSVMPDFDPQNLQFSASANATGQNPVGMLAGGNNSNYTININVDGAKYGDSRQLAEAISLELQNLLNRRKAVFA